MKDLSTTYLYLRDGHIAKRLQPARMWPPLWHHSHIQMKRCLPVLTAVCSVLLSNEDVEKRFACVFFVGTLLNPGPRLTSPHRSLPALLIMPLFVLTEYLLAYLLLITDSRFSVPLSSTPLSHTDTHTNAHTRKMHSWTPLPSCPWQSLIGPVSMLVGASHSVNGWVSLLVCSSVSLSVSMTVCQ